MWNRSDFLDDGSIAEIEIFSSESEFYDTSTLTIVDKYPSTYFLKEIIWKETSSV